MPWELIEHIEDIRGKLPSTQAQIPHTFKKENTGADALASEVIKSQSLAAIIVSMSYKKIGDK